MVKDISKRTTLKFLALTSGALAAPGLAAAACTHGKTSVTASAAVQTEPVSALRGTGLVVSFTDNAGTGAARNIIITNTTSEPITLSAVYPGIVTTKEGQYDLNSLLRNGPKVFAPKQATTLEIRSVTSSVTVTDQHTVPTEANPLDQRNSLVVHTQSSNVNFGEPVTTYRMIS